jgi:hypothetical protein
MHTRCCTFLLQALSALPQGTFDAELGRFFPVLTQLISCGHTTADVQRALSELFLARVGPLLVHGNGASTAATAAAAAAPAPPGSLSMAPPTAAAVFGKSLL